MEKGRARTVLIGILMAAAVSLLAGWIFHTWEKIPASIRIKSGIEQQLNLDVPMLGKIYPEHTKEAVPVLEMNAAKAENTEFLQVDLSQPVTMLANQAKNYKMDVRLFGVIPFKTVQVQVIPDRMLIPAGIPIGIYIKTDGIMVIGQGAFEGMDNTLKEPAKHLLCAGDYILKADEEEIASKAELIQKITDSEGKEMILTLRRSSEVFNIRVKPEQNREGKYKLGIWIRDNAQGVGTMTYMEPNHSFGALGHGINDTDTSLLMNVKSGSLYKTEIVAVKKGQGGTPGELTGIIDYNPKNKIGVIDKNSIEGIFGQLSEKEAGIIQAVPMPIGLKQEVRLGKAQILCCVDGQQSPQLYEIVIRAIHLDHDNVNRGLEITVTDPVLLKKTGGIVQGMSGSPIFQNGKFIGAVTHVLVNDPMKGYGIFIENMLQQ